MPGTHLNDLERGLSKTWASNNMPKSSLLSIHINGEKAIRGLNDVEIEFKCVPGILLEIINFKRGYHHPKEGD